jgi:hypothetical protein
MTAPDADTAMLTRDVRAHATYRRLGVAFRAIG